MMKYFGEANEDYHNLIGAKDHRQLRFATELISLAVCKANAVYVKRMRFGITKANTEPIGN